MTGATDVLERTFRAVLDASLGAALLAIATGVALWVLRDRVSARWKHAAWILVAVRLCLPWVPSSPVSLASLVPWPGEKFESGATTVITLGAVNVPMRDRELAPPRTTPPGPAVTASWAANGPSWMASLALVWLSGCLLTMARLASAAWNERRSLRRLAPLDDARLAEALAICSARLRLRRVPSLHSGPGVAVPSVTGLFRPRVLVPEDRLANCSIDEVCHVFLHELAHVKRRDVATNCLLSILGAVHWFNPAVRRAFLRAREERELACDELVLASASGSAAYASTLVRLIESSSFRAPAVAALSIRGDRFIERRLRWITGIETRRCSTFLSACLLACCAAVGLTCTTQDRMPTGAEVRSYDIAHLLETATDFLPPHLGMKTVEEAEAPPKPEPTEETRKKKQRSAEALAALIRSQVEPERWTRDSRIEIEDERLRVSAPGEVHASVQAFLDRALAEKGLTVSLNFKLLAFELIEDLSPALKKDVEALLRGEELRSRRLAPDELKECEAGARVESQPTLTLLNRQTSFILVIQQAAIIADVKSSVADGKQTWEPVLNVLNTGFAVQSRPEVNEDRKRAALQLQYEWADARKPFATSLVNGIPVAMPELSQVTHRASLDAPFGAWMLAGAFTSDIPKKETRVVLAKVELASPKEGAPEK